MRQDIKAVVYRAAEISFDAYATAVRDTEAAVLADLAAIVPPPRLRKGSRPGLLFSVALGRLLKRAAVVVEVRSEAISADDAVWLPAHEAAAKRVTSGRKTLPRKEARAMQAKSAAVRASRSALAAWRGEGERESRKFKQARAIWRSRDFANALEAQRALPEELHYASRKSLERIFGRRT